MENEVPPNFVNENFLTTKDFMKPNSHQARVFAETPEDEIVIGGVSGRYPSCDNIEQFSHNLYNKVSFSSVRMVEKNFDNKVKNWIF